MQSSGIGSRRWLRIQIAERCTVGRVSKVPLAASAADLAMDDQFWRAGGTPCAVHRMPAPLPRSGEAAELGRQAPRATSPTAAPSAASASATANPMPRLAPVISAREPRGPMSTAARYPQPRRGAGGGRARLSEQEWQARECLTIV
jgi:hypothetical protein